MPTRRETEVPGKRPSKRSTCPPASHPTWAILYKSGARDDDYDSNRDRAMSLTTSGEQISVSVKLVEPPRISILTVDLPQQQRPSMESTTILSDVSVVAAHRDLVLFWVNPRSMSESDSDHYDHFIYKASCGASERPSLLLLPSHYYEDQTCADRRTRQLLMTRDSTSILSSGSSRDNQDATAFVVADLVATHPESKDPSYNNRGWREFDLHVLWSMSCEWTVFKNLHVRGANGGRDLYWWSTDAVVPYRNRFFLWVDYYRGVIFADMADPEKQPHLRYVPLPVDPPEGDSSSILWNFVDRECPKASRSLCATHSGIRFVSVDHQRSSNYGVGHWKWTLTFRITTWSLRDDGVTWRKDARLYAEDLWALDPKKRFPHVQPKFPVISMENPNVLCFVADEGRYTPDSSNRVCMVEIDMKKKVLLAVTDYSKERHLFNLYSVMIATKLPRYRYAGEPCKKRRE